MYKDVTHLPVFVTIAVNDKILKQLATEGHKQLLAFRKFSGLSLSGEHVTDQGLKDMVSFEQLQFLTVTGPKISDDGLKHLAGLKELTSLNLGRTRVTGTGLKHLRDNRLTELRLDDCPISDSSMAEVGVFRDLRYLDLQGTKITDASAKELLGLTQLQVLNVARTQISQKGMASLRKGLGPKTNVMGPW